MEIAVIAVCVVLLLFLFFVVFCVGVTAGAKVEKDKLGAQLIFHASQGTFVVDLLSNPPCLSFHASELAQTSDEDLGSVQ